MALPLTAEQFLEIGLEAARVVGWTHCNRSTNVDRFKRFFGVIPETCAAMWNDLVDFTDDAVRLTAKDKPTCMLVVLRFLFLYETETNLGHFFGIRSRKTVFKICKEWTIKLSALLAPKVSSKHKLISSFTVHTQCRLLVSNIIVGSAF